MRGTKLYCTACSIRSLALISKLFGIVDGLPPLSTRLIKQLVATARAIFKAKPSLTVHARRTGPVHVLVQPQRPCPRPGFGTEESEQSKRRSMQRRWQIGGEDDDTTIRMRPVPPPPPTTHGDPNPIRCLCSDL